MSSQTKIKEEEEIISKKEDSNKEEAPLSLGFKILIVLTIAGTIALFCTALNFVNNLKTLNPDYEFVSVYDFLKMLLILGIIIILKSLVESVVFRYTEQIMSKKYFAPGLEHEVTKVKVKISCIVFKLIYYSSLTILGYKALSPLEYFPKELGGSGYMAKMFEKKFPDAFFHTKTPLFDLHYLICLSYSFVDLIWLILIDTRQLDFFVMLFHHICTSSLIIFSFVTQYSNVGSIVLFLHNTSDVVVYSSRLILYTNTFDVMKQVASVALLSAFLYMRMFVLGKVIYTIYAYTTWEWGVITFTLWSFLIFLYLMHLYWTLIILKRFYDAVFKGEFNDSGKFIKDKDGNKKKK